LYIPSYAICGGQLRAQEYVDALGKPAFRLPRKLFRLEIVEDPCFREGLADGKEAEGRRQTGKAMGLMRRLAGCCAQEKYFDLGRVVPWCRESWEGVHGWSLGEKDAVKETFREAGVHYTCLPFKC
jgi:hypothetical protein